MIWLLALVWVLFGLIAGALANAARLGFSARGRVRRAGWLATLGLGVLAALVGGLLGWLTLGRFFATPTALWVAALAVGSVPWLAGRVRERRGAGSAAETK